MKGENSDGSMKKMQLGQKTEFRNFGYSKENFIDSQTLTYKTHQPSMRKNKNVVKNP